MSVFKREGSPFYHYDFQTRGVRLRGTTGETVKRKAERFEDDLREQLKTGPIRGNMTLNQATGRYYTEVSDHQSSSKDTDRQLANLVKGLGKDTFLHEITENELAHYVSKRRAQRHNGKLISNATVNRDLETLRAVMRRANKVWKANVGEMPDWSLIMLKLPEGRIRELTPLEETALFENLRQDYHPMVLFCLLTGMRMNNVITLAWSQVDFDNQILTLKTKSKRPGGDIHIVPMTTEISNLLSAEKGRNPFQVFTYVCKKSRKDRMKGFRYPFTYGGWRKSWYSALKAAKIEDFRFHDLRHTGATRTLRNGNLKIVQQMLGHKDIASTARYAHAMVDDVRKAMEGSSPHNTPTTGKERLEKEG